MKKINHYLILVNLTLLWISVLFIFVDSDCIRNEFARYIEPVSHSFTTDYNRCLKSDRSSSKYQLIFTGKSSH